MQNYPVGSYDRDPKDAYRPVDLDHLETEGPMLVPPPPPPR